jgi:response regulator RpfG family c-di-GMP phosphodiesterase
MYYPATFDLIELDTIIDSYDYESDALLREHFRPVEEALWSLIEHYAENKEGNGYGRQLADHLRRTSLDGASFMRDALGFSQRAANNFHAANLFQDLGKIHKEYDPAIWTLPHRPTEDERTEKRKHTLRGPEVLAIALHDAPPALLDHPHIKIVIPAIQMFHHERVDGSGPFGKKGEELGQVIKMVALVDAKDGDMVQRGHQEFRRSEKEALLRMKGLPDYDKDGKYKGAFDEMLDRYIRYREKCIGEPILPPQNPVNA